MNNRVFQQARMSYATKDYERALKLFTSCLQDADHPLAAGETGLVYHQIGNCLVKLKNPSEAMQAYSQATGDAAYDAVGTVNYNLGMTYASLHDYENAAKHFEAALSDANYDAPYKAYTGLGNALMKVGKSAEAGVAFREAALDDRNPDPTKALLNLGVCFMALDRPADAVASYESALQFDMQDDTRNKLYANLGQAYVACGQMQKAVNAFEDAIADQTYSLSDSASVDYQRAIGAVAQGTASVTRVQEPIDASGLDVAASDEAFDDIDVADPVDSRARQAADDRFFTASDEDIERWSKDAVKQSRRRRNVGLKVALAVMVLLLVLFGVSVFGYTQGYGFPSQESVVRELFADPEGAADSVLSSSLSDTDVSDITSLLVTDADVTINGVTRSMSSSTVYATAATPEGGSLMYEVELGRDMIGWKVIDAQLYFLSQNAS